jgi:hypothetical protein
MQLEWFDAMVTPPRETPPRETPPRETWWESFVRKSNGPRLSSLVRLVKATPGLGAGYRMVDGEGKPLCICALQSTSTLDKSTRKSRLSPGSFLISRSRTLTSPSCRVLGALFAHYFIALICQNARMTALTRLVVNEHDIPSIRHHKLVRALATWTVHVRN